MLLADLSWDEAKEYLEHDDRLIFPMGATEQHGRHLGLGCDHQIADAIAQATGERTSVLVAPVLAYGMSLHHMQFAGTLSLKPATLAAALEDIFRTAYAHGFRRVLIVNGHGGNEPSIASALQILTNELEDLRVKAYSWWTEREILEMVDQAMGPQRGTHSSPGETAFLQAARPQAVKLERAAKRDAPVERSREFLNSRRFAEKYPDGVMGLEPSTATLELGRKLLERSVEICVDEIERWD